jgi:hypothetical protein
MARPKAGGPFEPLAILLRTILALLATLFVIAVLISVFGNGHVFSWAGKLVCLDAGSGQTRSHGLVATETEPAVDAFADTVTLCTPRPSTGQHLLAALIEAPTEVVYLAALILLYRLASTGDRHGPFTLAITRRARTLGYWLVLGGLTAAITEAIALNALLATMVTYPVGRTDWISRTHLPFGLIITGVGLITAARLLRIGVTMREEIETTV